MASVDVANQISDKFESPLSILDGTIVGTQLTGEHQRWNELALELIHIENSKFIPGQIITSVL